MILGVTVFSFLLSLGSLTPLHRLCYSVLPLFDTFRHPGNIRLFTSMGIILLAALYAQQLIRQNKEETKKTALRLLYIVAACLGLVTLYCLFQRPVRQNISAAFSNIKQPKALVDAFSFNSFLLIQCLAQIFFIALLAYQLRKKYINQKMTGGLFILNSVLFCWLALPFNFISQIRTSTINRYVRSFPKGYP
ncbi:MAG: hypothetical protein ABI688_07065, partial [Bacteroidota bacterium]